MSEKRKILSMRIDDEFESALEKGMHISGIRNKSDFVRMCVLKYLNEHDKKTSE